MAELLENRDLSHGCARNALILILKFDLLQRHSLVAGLVPGFVDIAVGPFTNLLKLLILVAHGSGLVIMTVHLF